MNGLIQRLVAAVATFGSFVTLVISLKREDEPFNGFQIVLMTVAVIAFIVSAAFDVLDYRNSRPRVMKSDRAIRDYMFTWIKGGGQVAVFSRSLGWVEDDEMTRMLSEKAAKKELTLVMPQAVEKSTTLEGLGAKAIYYGGGSDYAIKSRFTITNLGRTDTAVAIGSKEDGKHLVTEFTSKGNDPSFFLAQDLIDIVTLLAKSSDSGEGN